MLSLIRLVYHTFVNVDDHLALSHILDVVGCSQLPLQFSLGLVVGSWYGLNLLVGEAQLALKVPTEHVLS